MSGQAISLGQQQRPSCEQQRQGLESSSPCICKLKLEAGSTYFILILLSSSDGWAEASSLKTRPEDTGSEAEGHDAGQMDGR